MHKFICSYHFVLASSSHMATFSILLSLLCFSLSSISISIAAVSGTIGTCSSSCSNDKVDVRFPFWLIDDNPDEPQGPLGFGLRRRTNFNSTHLTETLTLTLALPNSGDFIVKCIDYKAQTLSINDPNGCVLLRFFQGFETSNSPFMASGFNYVLFNCSRDMPLRFRMARTCMSNSKYDVLAVYSETEKFKEETSSWCQEFTTIQIPCLNPPLTVGDMHTSDLAEDVVLRFAVPICKECERRGEVCGYVDDVNGEEEEGFRKIGCFDRGHGTYNIHRYPQNRYSNNRPVHSYIYIYLAKVYGILINKYFSIAFFSQIKLF